MVGDAGVGKTSLLTRATQDSYDKDVAQATIGFSFQKVFKEVPNTGCINLFIWDTAGQEMYRSMIKMYYRGVAVAIVCYDVSDRDSFEDVPKWFKDIRDKQNHRNLASGKQVDSVFYYLIGNKCDLDDDERAVTFEEAKEWVDEFKEEEEDFINISFMEVSAKDGTNVNELFDDIAKKLLDRHVNLAASAKPKPSLNDSGY